VESACEYAYKDRGLIALWVLGSLVDPSAERGYNTLTLKHKGACMYGFDHRKVRPATNRLIDMMDEGLIDARAVADMALSWLSESDVAEMMKANDLVEYDEDEDEDEYDGQPDEAQEWADFDPEC
jgi:hypothetical protein